MRFDPDDYASRGETFGIDSDIGRVPEQYRPYARILAAAFISGIHEAARLLSYQRYQWHKFGIRVRPRGDLAWVYDDTNAVRGFRWYCDVFNLDVTFVRQRIEMLSYDPKFKKEGKAMGKAKAEIDVEAGGVEDGKVEAGGVEVVVDNTPAVEVVVEVKNEPVTTPVKRKKQKVGQRRYALKDEKDLPRALELLKSLPDTFPWSDEIEAAGISRHTILRLYLVTAKRISKKGDTPGYRVYRKTDKYYELIKGES